MSAKKQIFIRRQENRLRTGQINRRRFIMSALSTGVTLPTATSLANRAEAAQPQKGGVLRFATGLSRDHFERSRLAHQITANCLAEITPSGEVTGELAERFETTSDNKLWVFDIQSGVTFPTGKPLTIEDVLASFERLRARNSLPSSLAEIRQEGPGSIQFRFETSEPDFARLVADPKFSVLTSASDTELPAGTGAFVPAEYSGSKAIRFARNPDYWKADRAHFDEIAVYFLPDGQARQSATLNGDVDLSDMVDPRSVALLQRSPAHRILKLARARHFDLSFPDCAGALDDPLLRTRLQQTIDRQDIIDKVLLGQGEVGEMDIEGVDPEVAAISVQECSLQRPLVLHVSPHADKALTDVTKRFAAAAQDAGIPVKVEMTPPEKQSHAHWVASLKDGMPVRGENTFIPAWAHDIWVYADRLQTGTDASGDTLPAGVNLLERAWFA